jgi:hypothetical protein
MCPRGERFIPGSGSNFLRLEVRHMHQRRFISAACAIGSLAVSAAWAVTNFSGNTAPSGAHYRQGFGEPICTVNSDLSVTCTGTQIAGVGNTDANITTSISYSGTVTCTNRGGNTVDVKTQTTSTTVLPDPVTRVRNGTLIVQDVTFGGDPSTALISQATCPNGNWKKNLSGSPTLESYSYSLTFVGYDQPAIVVTGP